MPPHQPPASSRRNGDQGRTHHAYDLFLSLYFYKIQLYEGLLKKKNLKLATYLANIPGYEHAYQDSQFDIIRLIPHSP